MRKSGSNRVSGNRDNGAYSGSRCANWNNAPSNSNWNIGLRAACDDTSIYRHHRCYGAGDRPLVCGQPVAAGFGKHTARSGERRVGLCPKAVPAFMGRKFKHLFEKICDRDNLWCAYHKASLGKRRTVGYLQFKQYEAANIARLEAELRDGSYRPGAPHVFYVWEPKQREISALPFYDRVAQHALCNVIEPIFDAAFVCQNYACRKGKGVHQAARDVQAMLRKTPDAWILKTDFSKYFANIDREILCREIRRKISCKQTLHLIETFIPSSGRGLPIGNLTSQLAANIYGHQLDRWLIHTLGVKNFARYMDDVVVIGRSREAMRLLQTIFESFADHEMGLRLSRWSVQPVEAGVNFCGYRIWPDHKLLRPNSVTRARRKLAHYRAVGDWLSESVFLASWRGHAKHANSHHLLQSLGVEL